MDQSLFAAPHGFSQRITSFIACACQGIHQMPLIHLIVLIADVHLLCPHAAAARAASLRTGRRTIADGLAPYGTFFATSFANFVRAITGPFV